jgi:hypothetical protein
MSESHRSESTEHDVAWDGTRSVVDLFAPLLNESEKREAVAEVYEMLRNLIRAYDRATDHRLRRLRPSPN